MKVVFIPLRRNAIFQILIVSSLFILLIFFNSTEAVTVLSPTFEPPIYNGNENNPTIAFECNVVWGTEYIIPMLQIFKEHDIRITFFIGGEWARKIPNFLKR